MSYCQFPLVRGVNRGKPCGRRCLSSSEYVCDNHASKEEEVVALLNKKVNDVEEIAVRAEAKADKALVEVAEVKQVFEKVNETPRMPKMPLEASTPSTTPLIPLKDLKGELREVQPIIIYQTDPELVKEIRLLRERVDQLDKQTDLGIRGTVEGVEAFKQKVDSNIQPPSNIKIETQMEELKYVFSAFVRSIKRILFL